MSAHTDVVGGAVAEDPADGAAVSLGLRRALGAGSAYGAVTVLRLLSGVLLLPLLTRALPVREYAVVALVAPLGWILQSVASFGLNDGLTRSTAHLPRGSAVAGAAVLRSTVLVVAAGGLVVLTGPLWSWPLLGIPWGAAPAWGVLTGTLMSVVAVVAAVLRSEERVLATTVMTTAAAVAAPFVGLAALLVLGRTAAVYLGGTALALLAVVVAALAWFAIGRRGLVRHDAWKGAGPVVRAGLRTGLPTVPHLVALLCLDAGLRRVVAANEGLAVVATFSVALVLGSLVWTMLKAFGAAWGPVVYRADRADAPELLRRVTRVLLLLAVGAQLALSWGAPLLVRVFLPASYGAGAALVVVAVALCSVPATVVSAQVVTLFDSGRTRVLAVATPLAVVFGVAVSVPVCQWGGAPAAALCYPLTYTSLALLLGASLRRRGLSSLVLDRPVLVAASVSAVVAATAAYAEGRGAPVGVRVVAALLELGCAVAVVGAGLVRRPLSLSSLSSHSSPGERAR